jgi:hypothetical protein
MCVWGGGMGGWVVWCVRACVCVFCICVVYVCSVCMYVYIYIYIHQWQYLAVSCMWACEHVCLHTGLPNVWEDILCEINRVGKMNTKCRQDIRYKYFDSMWIYFGSNFHFGFFTLYQNGVRDKCVPFPVISFLAESLREQGQVRAQSEAKYESHQTEEIPREVVLEEGNTWRSINSSISTRQGMSH